MRHDAAGTTYVETQDVHRLGLQNVQVRQRVGRYGVDLGVMERLALPELRPAATGPAPWPLVLIDELGRMELACAALRDMVGSLFQADVDVVATVHVHRDPFTDALKGRRDIDVVSITPANRDVLPEELARRLAL
ncbi:nucleoside-triphosphatase [Streptomyces sp. NPDC001020]